MSGVSLSLPAVTALMVVTAMLAGGCGGSDDGGDGDIGGQEGRGGAEAPAGSDLDAVQPLVEDLLEDYDRVVNEIVAEPSVAVDRDSELVREYLDIHEPGSDFAEEALDTWEVSADRGVSIQPYDDEHPALTTRLDGALETVSDDEVSVPACEVHREQVIENGQVTEGMPLLEQAVEVTAVRVDSQWLLRERVVRDDLVGCATTEEADG